MTENYSGADIKHICIKASLIPFKESITSGEEREIEMKDLLEAIKIVKPSIDRKTLEKYEKFSF